MPRRHLRVPRHFSPRANPPDLCLPRFHHPPPNRRRTLRFAARRISLYFTAGTSIWMSMRSSSGPESSTRSAGSSAACMALPRSVLKYPHGQGFIAAASMNRAGKVSDIDARAIVPCHLPAAAASPPAHFAEIPATHPETSTPLCASETSPGRGMPRRQSTPRHEIV